MNEFTREKVQLAAKGNQYAIEELYKLTYTNVYHTIKSIIQDEDTVLDIVQDSYIKGFQSLDQLDKPETFPAWIKRIAINKAKDYLKKKKPILFGDMVDEINEDIEVPDMENMYLPDSFIDRKETSSFVNEVLDTLSEEQRLVIGLFYYEEMSVKEIAEVLGCPEGTIKSRLNYGRKKIEAKIRELGNN